MAVFLKFLFENMKMPYFFCKIFSANTERISFCVLGISVKLERSYRFNDGKNTK